MQLPMSRDAEIPYTSPVSRLFAGRMASMPLSKCTLVGSIVLWGSILSSGFLLISYITVYVTLGNDDDLKRECSPNKLTGSDTKTLESLKSIDVSNVQRTEQFHKAASYLRLNSARVAKPLIKTDIPPFVTAVSSDTFYSVQGLLRQIIEELLPLYRGKADVKLIVVDLGMTDSERNVFKKHCRCQLWTMDNSALPNHVTKMELYSYRSIVIQYVLAELGSVIWMDPTTRLVSARVPEAIKEAQKHGFMLWQYSYPVLAKDKKHEHQFVYNYESLIAYTNPSMFEYLNERRCKYITSRIIDTRLMIFYRNDAVHSLILKPWLSCVLDENCVSPRSSRYMGCFDDKSPSYTGCHRYEMSVLSIIVETLRGFVDQRSFQPVLDVKSGRGFDTEEYFPERPISRRQRDVILVSVVIIVIVVATSSLWGSIIIRWIGMPVEWFKPKCKKSRFLLKKDLA